MSFITDKQTLDDLNIFGKRGKQSVYAIFNRTCSRGGAEQLEEMFRYPLSDTDAINRRSGIIRFFQGLQQPFPFSSEWFDTIEQYIGNTDERSQLTHEDNTLGRKFKTLIGSDTEYQLLTKGVSSLVEVVQGLRRFLYAISPAAAGTPYATELVAMQSILDTAGWEPVYEKKSAGRLSFEENAAFDKLFRYQYLDEVKKLLYYIYTLDVYMSVAQVATARKFVFPEAIEKEKHSIHLTNVYHPQLEKPVANTLDITPDSNVIFLTGANMAGKSTFMKSLGIALFLAHMGFPVPAEKMQFSVREGIFTTINLPDNLHMGYSHFYAEVLRVKKVAEQLGRNRSLFVIFDELFRGTNVKDAYEATVAITAAFATKRNCMFVISTHIMEAGDTLRPVHPNINFMFLPTRMEQQKPVYPYKLEQGITADRHGMVIINNEGILDILENGITKAS
jgi:DNA mismatch repair ATPase MutS